MQNKKGYICIYITYLFIRLFSYKTHIKCLYNMYNRERERERGLMLEKRGESVSTICVKLIKKNFDLGH